MSETNNNSSQQAHGSGIKPMLSSLNYYILLAMVWVISCAPFGVLHLLSDVLYFPLYHIVRYRRRIVRRNLVESFPEKSEREIIAIEKQFYHSFIDVILESLKLVSISPEKMMRHMKFVNIDYVNSLLDEGKSVSVFIGHYGNWEWLASMGLVLRKGPIQAHVFHMLRNDATNRLMHKMRGRFGHVSVDMYKTARFIAAAKKDNRQCIIGYIADQSPKFGESKHFIPFLNHNVPVLTGTEKLTKHFGFDALFMGMKRVKRGYYECRFTPLHPDPKSLPDFELTQLYYQQLEAEIREHPELYLWTHNRFKHAIYNNDVCGEK
ncbi:MAG: lysophospholipid acyltransferase family protein [Muribaculaceae bacterium]